MTRRCHAGLGAWLHFTPIHEYFAQQENALENEIAEAKV